MFVMISALALTTSFGMEGKNDPKKIPLFWSNTLQEHVPKYFLTEEDSHAILFNPQTDNNIQRPNNPEKFNEVDQKIINQAVEIRDKTNEQWIISKILMLLF